MIKNLMKSLVICGCIAGVLSTGDAEGMKKGHLSKSVGDLSPHAGTSPTPRRLSDPVTVKEKEHAKKITSMAQFRELTKEQAGDLKSVSFEKIEINEEFVDRFWELFPRGIEKLEFDSCKPTEGYGFADLFDGDYQVCELSVINSGIALDDVDNIFFRMYPYTMKHFNFSGNQLDKAAVSQCLYYRLGSFADTVDCFL